MSDESAALTATFKGAGGFDAPWLVVRADTPQDMLQRLGALGSTGILAKLAAVSQELHAVYGAAQGLGANAIVSVPDPAPVLSPIPQGVQFQVGAGAQNPVTNNGWGNTVAGIAALAAGQQPVQPQQQQAPGGPLVKQDRFGNTFVYNDPAAPMCQRGPMVKATRTKKAGGTYDKWLDPAHKACPLWREQGNPPVDPSQLAEEQWTS